MVNYVDRDTVLCISLAARPSNHGVRFHNWLYDKLGLNYLYKAVAPTDIAQAVAGIRGLGIRGAGVSMPYKQAVIPLVDELHPSAARIEAVNTIVNTDGRLVGYNTDYVAVAVTIAIDDEETREVMEAWQREDFGIPLRMLASPYREITQPFLRYVADLRTENPRDVVAVYIPDFVVGHWWESLLHNQTAMLIRTRLHFMKGVMVISVPYQLSSARRQERRRGIG